MGWTKEELEKILENDFINNPFAFESGHRNDDVVDSMCICFALDIPWVLDCYNKWAKQFDPNYTSLTKPTYWTKYIEDHFQRVDNWLENKEAQGYKRGEFDIMIYSINY